MVLFCMDKLSDKTLWINQEDERGGALLNGPFIEPRFVRVGKAAVLEKMREVGYDHPYKMCKRQCHGHIQIKGYLGIRQASSPEIVMV